MEIVEKFLLGKEKNQDLCEDGYIVTNDYVVVIDGAGTPSDIDYFGKKGGRYIMEVIRELIPKMKSDVGPEMFIENLNRMILERYKSDGFYEKLKEDVKSRAFANLVVYSNQHRQVWFYGDCRAYIGKQIDNEKYIDEVTSTVRKLFLETELRLGKTVEELREKDTGREFIDELLRRQALLQNTKEKNDFTYSCVDGFNFDTKDIKIIDVPKEEEFIILASDGYVVLRDNLKETEAILGEQLKNDPLAINELKGVKAYREDTNSFDDRVYIKIKIS